jgi:hypothetical protein
MRRVEVSRFVRATPREVERALDPASVIDWEGTFSVTGVEETDANTLVEAKAAGMGVTFRFEHGERVVRYEQERGPFASMWTEVAWRAENEGSRVTAESSLSLGVPPRPVVDRVGAWKRRGELRRLLAGLAETVE